MVDKAEKDEKMRLRHGEGREGQDRQVVHRAEEVRDRRWVHGGGVHLQACFLLISFSNSVDAVLLGIICSQHLGV